MSIKKVDNTEKEIEKRIKKTLNLFNKYYGNDMKCVFCKNNTHLLMDCEVAKKEGRKIHYDFYNMILYNFKSVILDNDFDQYFEKKYSKIIYEYIHNSLLQFNITNIFLLVHHHCEEIPDFIELAIDKCYSKELIFNKMKIEDFQIEKIENIITLLSHYYLDNLIFNLNNLTYGNFDGYNEDSEVFTYFREKNDIINVHLDCLITNLTFVCKECNIQTVFLIRTNCNHFICENCFDGKLERFNLFTNEDSDFDLHRPECKCKTIITDIYVDNQNNIRKYTPLMFGIKPFIL